jgi:hypothetical protein
MRPVWRVFGVLTLVAAGCRSNGDRLSPDSARDHKSGNVSTGHLVVEAAPFPPAPKNGNPATLYTVYDDRGREVARSSTMSTTLPAGTYLVHLEGFDAEVREFWVTIESGKTTYVKPSEVEVPHPATVR